MLAMRIGADLPDVDLNSPARRVPKAMKWRFRSSPDRGEGQLYGIRPAIAPRNALGMQKGANRESESSDLSTQQQIDRFLESGQFPCIRG